jgi:phage terminase small subunit
MSEEKLPGVKMGRRPISEQRVRRDVAVTRLEQAILRAAPWLQSIDRPVLHGFCEIDRLARELYTNIRADGGAVRSDGSVHHLLGPLLSARKVQMLAASRLGLDPKSRSEMEGGQTLNTVDLDVVNSRIQKVLRQRYAGTNESRRKGSENGTGPSPE